jgi:hypothetical protein
MATDRLRKPRGSRGADFRREQRIWVGWRRRRRPDRPSPAEKPEAPSLEPARAASAPAETSLEQAARIVKQGDAIVERQRELVFHLRRNGQPTTDAEKILRSFQQTLFEYRKYLAMLQNLQRRGL